MRSICCGSFRAKPEYSWAELTAGTLFSGKGLNDRQILNRVDINWFIANIFSVFGKLPGILLRL